MSQSRGAPRADDSPPLEAASIADTTQIVVSIARFSSVRLRFPQKNRHAVAFAAPFRSGSGRGHSRDSGKKFVRETDPASWTCSALTCPGRQPPSLHRIAPVDRPAANAAAAPPTP